MKIYLWYDHLKEMYLTARSTEANISGNEVLFAFDLENVALSRKIARNLNSLR